MKFDDFDIFIAEIKELFDFQGLTQLQSSGINVPCYNKVVPFFYVNFEIGSNYDHSSYTYNVHIKIDEEVISRFLGITSDRLDIGSNSIEELCEETDVSKGSL